MGKKEGKVKEVIGVMSIGGRDFHMKGVIGPDHIFRPGCPSVKCPLCEAGVPRRVAFQQTDAQTGEMRQVSFSEENARKLGLLND